MQQSHIFDKIVQIALIALTFSFRLVTATQRPKNTAIKNIVITDKNSGMDDEFSVFLSRESSDGILTGRLDCVMGLRKLIINLYIFIIFQ